MTQFFKDHFPGYLVGLRADWSLTAKDLPDPVLYLPREPRRLDRWPLLATTAVNDSMRRVELTDENGILYDTTYSLRTFVWVNESGWDRAIDVRDDLTTALETLILDCQTLRRDPIDVVVREESLLTEYADVTPVKGDRFVTGAYVAYDLVVAETVARTASGTVELAMVQAGVLPHPALD